VVYYLPQDLIDNTLAAFELGSKPLDPTKPYIGAPTTAGQLGSILYLYGPWTSRYDLNVLKRTKLSEKTNLGSDPIMFTVLLGMIVILAADIFLGVQLSRLIKASLSPYRLSKRKTAPAMPLEISGPTTARLAPTASVTENTTRFLEETYRPPAETQRRNT